MKINRKLKIQLPKNIDFYLVILNLFEIKFYSFLEEIIVVPSDIINWLMSVSF